VGSCFLVMFLRPKAAYAWRPNKSVKRLGYSFFPGLLGPISLAIWFQRELLPPWQNCCRLGRISCAMADAAALAELLALDAGEFGSQRGLASVRGEGCSWGRERFFFDFTVGGGSPQGAAELSLSLLCDALDGPPLRGVSVARPVIFIWMHVPAARNADNNQGYYLDLTASPY
jgi:hypothetical protein